MDAFLFPGLQTLWLGAMLHALLSAATPAPADPHGAAVALQVLPSEQCLQYLPHCGCPAAHHADELRQQQQARLLPAELGAPGQAWGICKALSAWTNLCKVCKTKRGLLCMPIVN